MDSSAVLRWCESEAAWLRHTIETLVRLESPSTDKAAVDRCGAAIASHLRELGGTVEILAEAECGDHVRAVFSGSSRRVLLLGHFDTVWPVGQIGEMPVREEGGRLYGPGIFDMKSGIAVSMLAVRALAALDVRGAPTVSMLWTTDEEIGSGTSRTTIEEEARRSDAVLVLEPSLPGGAAKTSRKGCGDFELTVHGVAAHAGIDPGRGVSAIHEIAQHVMEIAALQDLARGISVNVGRISGGSRTNVIAERAEARIDVRVPTMAEASRIERAIRARQAGLPGTRVEVTGGFGRPPLERGEHVERLYLAARDVAAELGRDLKEGGTGGGSDGNFTAALGVPTLDGLGPCGDGAHARDEHVELADLPWRAAFLTALLAHLGRADSTGGRGSAGP